MVWTDPTDGSGTIPPNVTASILVRARNDEALVGRTLEGIFAQEGTPPFEVVVCDDASTDRTREVAARFPVRFVGIEPAVKPAALTSRTGAIGVLATASTLASAKYLKMKEIYGDKVTIAEGVGQGFVELVEAGELAGPRAEAIARASLEPLLDAGADRIALGCTHYPFLKETLEKVAAERGADIRVIDPAVAVARRLVNVLAEEGIPLRGGSDGTTELLASGPDTVLKKIYSSL